ncbi:hypothetical protein V6N13_077578 [Hibiscus sabdariffa]|uniref:Uncharacterized protein n=1 Tax=Hibiscus sabdariffa TaxID=183260 RepID=A0ABR2CRM6_9ROSI
MNVREHGLLPTLALNVASVSSAPEAGPLSTIRQEADKVGLAEATELNPTERNNSFITQRKPSENMQIADRESLYGWMTTVGFALC